MTPQPGPDDDRPWRRMRVALLSRPSRAQLVVALLCGLLGFGLVTQVHATSSSAGLGSARTNDLLGILSDLDNRGDRLRAEIADLQVSEQRLRSGSGRDRAALQAARDRADTLGILTGTLAAKGPGIVLTMTDPRGQVSAAVLLDAVEELRDAGAEALQLSGVRIVASTPITDNPAGGVDVGGRPVLPPYRLAAIGGTSTLAGALAIPGGVIDSVDRQPGAHAVVTRSVHPTITALQPLAPPRYARPARSARGERR
jgi:uncharacterized protein YlxW (UPF0749 family)